MNSDELSNRTVTLIAALKQLIEVIKIAVNRYQTTESHQFDVAYGKWKNTALRLLLEDLDKLQFKSIQVSDQSSHKTLQVLAEKQVHLSKNLDTFVFEFAGEDLALLLGSGVSKVVQAADDLSQNLYKASLQ